jgi:hypothetical protein
LTRGQFFFVVTLAIIIGLVIWAVPEVKRRFISDALEVKVKFLSVEDDDEVEYNDTTVPKRVTVMDIYFPLGSEPGNISELEVRDEAGKSVDVIWSPPEVTTMEDSRQTRWRIKYAFFPPGFQGGMLRNKVRELKYMHVPTPPYSAPADDWNR